METLNKDNEIFNYRQNFRLELRKTRVKSKILTKSTILQPKLSISTITDDSSYNQFLLSFGLLEFDNLTNQLEMLLQISDGLKETPNLLLLEQVSLFGVDDNFISKLMKNANEIRDQPDKIDLLNLLLTKILIILITEDPIDTIVFNFLQFMNMIICEFRSNKELIITYFSYAKTFMTKLIQKVSIREMDSTLFNQMSEMMFLNTGNLMNDCSLVMLSRMDSLLIEGCCFDILVLISRNIIIFSNDALINLNWTILQVIELNRSSISIINYIPHVQELFIYLLNSSSPDVLLSFLMNCKDFLEMSSEREVHHITEPLFYSNPILNKICQFLSWITNSYESFDLNSDSKTKFEIVGVSVEILDSLVYQSEAIELVSFN